jgi:hypothetical protein
METRFHKIPSLVASEVCKFAVFESWLRVCCCRKLKFCAGKRQCVTALCCESSLHSLKTLSTTSQRGEGILHNQILSGGTSECCHMNAADMQHVIARYIFRGDELKKRVFSQSDHPTNTSEIVVARTSARSLPPLPTCRRQRSQRPKRRPRLSQSASGAPPMDFGTTSTRLL